MTERLPRCEPMPKAVPCNTCSVQHAKCHLLSDATTRSRTFSGLSHLSEKSGVLYM